MAKRIFGISPFVGSGGMVVTEPGDVEAGGSGFTGTEGSVPFTGADGALTEAPTKLAYDPATDTLTVPHKIVGPADTGNEDMEFRAPTTTFGFGAPLGIFAGAGIDGNDGGLLEAHGGDGVGAGSDGGDVEIRGGVGAATGGDVTIQAGPAGTGAAGIVVLAGGFINIYPAAGAAGGVRIVSLPTSDPGVSGQLWADSLVVKVSAG